MVSLLWLTLDLTHCHSLGVLGKSFHRRSIQWSKCLAVAIASLPLTNSGALDRSGHAEFVDGTRREPPCVECVGRSVPKATGPSIFGRYLGVASCCASAFNSTHSSPYRPVTSLIMQWILMQMAPVVADSGSVLTGAGPLDPQSWPTTPSTQSIVIETSFIHLLTRWACPPSKSCPTFPLGQGSTEVPSDCNGEAWFGIRRRSCPDVRLNSLTVGLRRFFPDLWRRLGHLG